MSFGSVSRFRSWVSSFLSPRQPNAFSSCNITKVSLVDSIARKAVQQSQERFNVHLSENTITALSITDGSASLIRNILRSLPFVDAKNSIVNGLGHLSSAIGLVLGSIVTVESGCVDLRHYSHIQDGEGQRRASIQIVAGMLATNGSALRLTKAIASVGIGVSYAADALCGIGAIVSMGLSGLEMYRCAMFCSRMDGYLNTQDMSERERVIKALEFLKQKISLTEQERQMIIDKVESSSSKLSASTKKSLIDRKLIDLAEVKINYIKRRTNKYIAERLVSELDKHLSALRDPCAQSGQILAARQFVEEIKRASKKRMLILAIVGITSAIAFTAFLAGTVFSLGTLPFILYAISASISLIMILYPMLSFNLRKETIDAMKENAVTLAPTTMIETGPGN